MLLLGARPMGDLDKVAIAGGVSSLYLMENAAEALAKVAKARMGENPRAAVFCGSGNNGGDGVCAAVWLLKAGAQVRVFLVGDRAKLTPDTAEMTRRLEALGGKLEPFAPDSLEIEAYCQGAGVLIDAMFGVGFHGSLRGLGLEAAKLMNRLDTPVVAADIASGVLADDGQVLGEAVRAQETVTFTFAKPGHFCEPGSVYTGKLHVVPIGIPEDLVQNAQGQIYAAQAADARLPQRPVDGHKGLFGKLLILAGSRGYTGAPSLAAQAAVHTGAGLVYLGVPESIYAIEAVKNQEAMPFPLPAAGDGLALAALDKILEKAAGCNVCLIGPGLGRAPETAALVHRLLETLQMPVVLDADGINALEGHIDILDKAPRPLILTPHPGEFSRLMPGWQAIGRLAAARQFAADHGCILILKGHNTVTALPDGRAYLNTTGNVGMARGGSGDVLAGMVAALAGQMPAAHAAVAAVWLHGMAGDLCAKQYGVYSMTPTQMIAAIGPAIEKTTL